MPLPVVCTTAVFILYSAVWPILVVAAFFLGWILFGRHVERLHTGVTVVLLAALLFAASVSGAGMQTTTCSSTQANCLTLRSQPNSARPINQIASIMKRTELRIASCCCIPREPTTSSCQFPNPKMHHRRRKPERLTATRGPLLSSISVSALPADRVTGFSSMKNPVPTMRDIAAMLFGSTGISCNFGIRTWQRTNLDGKKSLAMRNFLVSSSPTPFKRQGSNERPSGRLHLRGSANRAARSRRNSRAGGRIQTRTRLRLMN